MSPSELTYTWEYESEEAVRVDKFLAQEGQEWSRSQIQQWIADGRVHVNDKVIKSNYKLVHNDHIIVSIPAPQEMNIQAETMPLDIVYEDSDVLVVNKPKGLVVHPAPGNYTGTLVNGLLAYCQDLSGINGVLRPGIVHRIDKDTSGLIMVAKNDRAHLSLSAQLKEHSVTRKYVAFVQGYIQHPSGTIDAPIGRHPQQRKQMEVVAGGKKARTHFKVLERLSAYTVVELELETGRTHQIRVHMKYIGHPLVGDPKYGTPTDLALQGQALHAMELGFDHPTSGKRLQFDCPLPPDMAQVLLDLRAKE